MKNNIKVTFYSLLFFLLFPFLFIFYFTKHDFLTRFFFLIVIVFFALIYENFQYFFKKFKHFLNIIFKNKTNIFFIILIFSILFTILFTSPFPYLGGDEPHYLVVTQSIVGDGDLNLKNNYSEKTYTGFHPVDLRPHIRRIEKDKWYSFHSPGTSVFFIPAYLVKKYFFKNSSYFITTLIFRIYISIFVILFLFIIKDFFIRKFGFKNPAIFSLLCLFYFTTPLFFFSIHIYPEIIAFMISFSAYVLLENKKSSGLLPGILLSLLIFFHTKFLVIQIGFIIYRLIVKRRSKTFILFCLPQILTFVLHIFYLKIFYKTLSPTLIYMGMKFSEWFKIVLSVPLIRRVESFLNYFLDQRDGLLSFSMYFFIVFLAFKLIIRNKKHLKLFFSVFLLYTGYYAFLVTRGAYSPPARPLIPVLWVLFIYLLDFWKNSDFTDKKILYVFSFQSIFMFVVLLFHPLFLYQPTTSAVTRRAGAVFSHLSNLYIYFPKYLPSFLKIDNLSYLPNYIWLLIFIILPFLYYYNKKLLSRILFVIVLSFLFISRVAFPYVQDKNPETLPSIKKLVFYDISKDLRKLRDGKKGFFIVKNRNNSFRILFSSTKEIEKLKIKVGNINGEYKVKLRIFDRKILNKKISEQNITINNPPLFKKHYKHYYFIKFFIKSKNKLKERPFIFEFLQIEYEKK